MFYCIICFNIVPLDFVECSECAKLFCQNCIDHEVKKRGKASCPNCKKMNTIQSGNRNLKDILGNMDNRTYCSL